MKKMKKILSVVLTLAMVLGMSVTTFAETSTPGTPGVTETPATGKSGDTGKITIGGFALEDGEVPSGLTISAYQVVKAVYANNETITDGKGDNNGSFSSYAAVYGESAVGAGNVIDTTPIEDPTDKTKVPEITISEDQLTAVWNHIAEDDANVDNEACNQIEVAVTADNTKIDAANGTFSVTLTGLKVGSYLIAVSGSESKIYNPIVASIYYKVNADSTGNILDEANFSILSTDSWVKVTDGTDVEKWVIGDDGNSKGNSANIKVGDKIEFAVPITPIPNYGGKYPVFNVVDTLDKGFTYNGDLRVVIPEVTNKVDDDGMPIGIVGDKELKVNEDYTLDVQTDNQTSKTTITVDFVVSGYKDIKGTTNDYTLNEYVGKSAIIFYSATLNENAADNYEENVNDVSIKYTKDSNINGEDNPDVIEEKEDKTFTYTFDINGGANGSTSIEELTSGILTKTGEETGEDIVIGNKTIKDVLKDAEFTLYTVNPDTFKPTDDDKLEDHIYTNVIHPTGIIASAENGQLPIRGLAAGTTDKPAKYYLKETKAPTGYSLNAHVFEIAIEATYHEESNKDTGVEAGQLKSWKITIDGKTTNEFTVSHDGGTVKVYTNGNEENGMNTSTVPNTKIASLPSTGGIGTTIFTFGGCAIMILAAALYFISRRKSAR